MKFLPIIALLAASLPALAQQDNANTYQSAVGGKIAGAFGATYKHFLQENRAAELQGTAFNEGVRFTGLYQFHFNSFEGLPGLRWYAGPGVHFGIWNKKAKAEYNSIMDVGIDGVIGLDYKFKGLPLNISLDWQPGFSILGAGVQPQFGGLAIRYVIR